jgi:hypothetical protein
MSISNILEYGIKTNSNNNKSNKHLQYNGAKLPTNLDNPYDSLMKYISEKSLPILKSLNFTPNILTLAGGVFVILSITCILKYKFAYAALFYAIAYWFDRVDGQYARHYNLTSQIGGDLDQFIDVARNILTCISIYIIKIPTSKKLIFAALYIIFTLINIYASNCIQNYYYSHTKTDDIYHMKYQMEFCKEKPEEQLKYIRYFGSGTKILVIILFLLYLNLTSK